MGFELLYWIPFLRWFRTIFNVPRERLVVVSRGGVASWYADLADTYVEVLDYSPPEELQRWTAKRRAITKSEKQLEATEEEAGLLRDITADLGLNGHSVLHPSLMFKSFAPFWDWKRTRQPLMGLTERTIFHPLSVPLEQQVEALPSSYVAVKAYFRESFPDQVANRTMLELLVSRLARVTNVVVLASGTKIDNYLDLQFEGIEGVHLARAPDPRQNLGFQTHIMARARALFSTYGGLTYLGPFLNVPTYAFYSESEGKLNPFHIELMGRAQHDLRLMGCRDAGLNMISTENWTALLETLIPERVGGESRTVTIPPSVKSGG